MTVDNAGAAREREALEIVRAMCIERHGISWWATIFDIERLQIDQGFRDALSTTEELMIERAALHPKEKTNADS